MTPFIKYINHWEDVCFLSFSLYCFYAIPRTLTTNLFMLQWPLKKGFEKYKTWAFGLNASVPPPSFPPPLNFSPFIVSFEYNFWYLFLGIFLIFQKKRPQRRDNAAAVSNSGMGMLSYVLEFQGPTGPSF